MHPILLELGPFRLDSYWVFIVVGGFISAAFWHSKRRAMGLRTDQEFWLLVNTVIFSLFIGGRVLNMLVYVPFSRGDYWELFFARASGFSILGSLLGLAVGVGIYCRRLKLGFTRLFDYICAMGPVWHFFGRLGCFSAGCCYGRPISGSSWGMIFNDPRSAVPAELLGKPLYPTQLYEAGGNLVLAAALLFVFLPRIESGRWRPGTLAAAYFGGYGILRLGVEFYRGDVERLSAGFTAGQAISALLIALSLGALLALSRRAA